MTKDIFAPADILLPGGVPMETWSVIACDQFSSERDYWERVREKVGDAPSTLKIIIPETYLETMDEEAELRKIHSAMDDYINRGLLRSVEDSFIYVERTQSDGKMRRGLVGAVDLEEYDFSGLDSAIRASEGTVLERLPARIRVRRAAKLEAPHIITFIDDKDKAVIEPLSDKADKLPLLYDFDLMEGGGHIKGMRVSGDNAAGVMEEMRKLREKNGLLMVVGDGNHSLAAAKTYWDTLKQGLSEASRETHPARRALVEVNNVYDPAISFEAIHRVVFNIEPAELSKAVREALPRGDDYKLRLVSRGSSDEIGVCANCIGDMLTALQAFFDGYAAGAGCVIDYIHDTEAALHLAEQEHCLGLLLPSMDKSELFAAVSAGGVFPKKSFSVGQARDKRYYLECRAITDKK